MRTRTGRSAALAIASVLLVSERWAAAQLESPLTSVSTSQFQAILSSAVTMVPDRETIADEASRARWKLGPIRLRPRIYIGNLGYTNNFFGTNEEKKGSFTASAGAGTDLIVPVGTRAFLKGGVHPVYTWYSRENERSSFGGTYDASLFFYPGRLSFQLTGGFDRYSVNLNSENAQPVEQSVLQGRLLGSWDLTSRFLITGSVAVQRRTHGTSGLLPVDAELVSRLDSTDSAWSIGVNRRIGTRLLIGVKYESGNFTFQNQGDLRDSKSQGIFGTVYLDRGRLQINIQGGFREFTASGGSRFVEQSGVSGGANLQYRLSRVFSLRGNVIAGIIPSLYTDNAVFDERRLGVSLITRVRRLILDVGYEIGNNRYSVDTRRPDGVVDRRVDDVETVRGSLNLPVYRALSMTATAYNSRYTSNVPGFDRNVFAIATTINLGASGIELLGPNR